MNPMHNVNNDGSTLSVAYEAPSLPSVSFIEHSIRNGITLIVNSVLLKRFPYLDRDGRKCPTPADRSAPPHPTLH